MKVVVTSTGPDLDSRMDSRLGRAEKYVFVDTNTLETIASDNPAGFASAGAGVQSAKFIVEQGAEAVLTGNCGPNAFSALAAGGVEVYVGSCLTVRDMVEAFLGGKLRRVSGASVESHFGMRGNS